jgi:hypothetical protein
VRMTPAVRRMCHDPVSRFSQQREQITPKVKLPFLAFPLFNWKLGLPHTDGRYGTGAL